MPDKRKLLYDLKNECNVFYDELYKENKKVIVFGEGCPDSKIILVGEAPGEQETLQRKVFVGKAGRNLSEFLDLLQLNREDIYITNAVKFRPCRYSEKTKRVSNRPPTGREVSDGKRWLFEEISIINPLIVVSMGNVALNSLFDSQKVSIGEYHGRMVKFDLKNNNCRYDLFPLYHPASIIYRRELKGDYIEDLMKLKKILIDVNII